MSPGEFFRSFDKGDTGLISEDRFANVLGVFSAGAKPEDKYFRTVFRNTATDPQRGMTVDDFAVFLRTELGVIVYQEYRRVPRALVATRKGGRSVLMDTLMRAIAHIAQLHRCRLKQAVMMTCFFRIFEIISKFCTWLYQIQVHTKIVSV